MPDQNNNLDPELLSQLPQYKAGFDNLRDAVNNLNKEIANSTDAFTKLNNQNKETVNWGTQIKSTVKDLADTYKTAKAAIEIATDAFKGWQGIASAVFTLITTYGPQVLDFLSNMFQSDKIKQAAINLQNYNNVMTAYIENVSGGLAQAAMLVKIAGNANLGQKTQLETLKNLISLSPEHLKNLTLQNLKTKEGKALVDEYTKSLKRRTLEEATLAQQTKIEQDRQNLKLQRDNARQNLDDIQKGKKANNTNYITATTSTGNTVTVGSYTDEDKAKDDLKTINAEVNEKDKKLVAQLNALDNDLAQKLILNKANTTVTKDKSYWENLVTSLQESLNNLDASSKDYAAKAKPIADRIKQARKTLDLYNVKPEEKPRPKTGNTKKSAVDPHAEEKARQESADRMALLLLDGYAKEVEETNQHFDQLHELHKGNNATIEQLEKERTATLDAINQKFQTESLNKLTGLTTHVTGGLLYGASTSAIAELAIGAPGTVLHGGTLPSYSAIATADIASNAVTYAKMQTVTTNKLLGSGSGTAVQEITLGAGLSFSGTTLNVTGGSGTVTNFGFTNANGITGTVSNATTTPTLSLNLGAITPTSVAASGAISGSNFSGSSSGTNTGDQTNITGNAGTVTNGVYTNGTYANPTFITSLSYSKLTDAPDLSGYVTLIADNTFLGNNVFNYGIKVPVITLTSGGSISSTSGSTTVSMYQSGVDIYNSNNGKDVELTERGLTLGNSGYSTLLNTTTLTANHFVYLQDKNGILATTGDKVSQFTNDANYIVKKSFLELSSSQALNAGYDYFYTGSGEDTFTLPAITISNAGGSSAINIKNRGSGNLTISGTIYLYSATSSITLSPGQSTTLIQDSSYWNAMANTTP